MPAPLAEVVSDFAEVQGQDKLQLLLEFADELPALPADLEEAAMEPVPECQSPLFLHVDAERPRPGAAVLQRARRGADHPRVRLDPGRRVSTTSPPPTSWPCPTTSTPTWAWRR